MFPTGVTVRVATLVTTPPWTTPSDQVTFQGGVPVRSAVTFVDCPEQIVPPPLTVAVGRSEAVTGRELLALHAPSVTVTERSIAPGESVLKVMLDVPAPESIVPPWIPHAYVAPAPAFGTDALFAAPTQTAAGALIAADGVGFTVIVALPVGVPAQTESARAFSE